MANTYTLIASNTLSSSAASVTFSSIPANYTDLVLRMFTRESGTGIYQNIQITFNGSSANSYTGTYLQGSGSAASSGRETTATAPLFNWGGINNTASQTSNTFASSELYIPRYLARTNKPSGGFSVTENNATAAYIWNFANLWGNTSEITSITIATPNSFVSGSSFFLYGISRIGASSVPNAPTIGTATAGGEEASVTFTPSGSGSAAESFAITSNPGSIIGRGLSSPIIVKGLTGGTAYTFTATAVNNIGDSAASSATGSVTPSVTAGYVAGGFADSLTELSSIEKLQFSNETRSLLGATLTYDRDGTTGHANSGVAGYWSGGYDGTSRLSSQEKVTFSTDSVSLGGGNLGASVNNHAGMANSGTAGYVGGGYTSTYVSAIYKTTYSSETTATSSAVLGSVNANLAAFANSGTAGYFAGGYSGSATLGSIDKLTFSTDTRATLGATLPTSRYNHGSMANSGIAGYVGGGYGATLLSSINKLTFSTDATSTVTATLSTGTQNPDAFAKSGTAGYFAGGQPGTAGANYHSRIEKLAFSDEARTTLSATLSVARANGNSGLANSGTL